ncbi:MAG: chromosome segregation protein SMC [Clostridiales bacterium]|nr:chromosome segregation protein SMC [Clostridiales bacterium]
MRLKKLELYGFKSFPERTEIVFKEGITAIVGPNGSGKSNIADAVRWVLGEQSAKTLRGASMQDVIFGGTQRRKPLSYCEVSLVFDNEDKSLPLDYSEILVTRRVYRSGESEYFLNRASCRLKDVVDLFRDTGIGKEGYSIIGQGRIDEILSRKGEDRRQVFEEAAGIVKFRARKEEADRKLVRTQENIARVDDLLEELKSRLGPLEEDAKNARVYLDYSARLKVLDLNLFLVRSDKMEAKLREADLDLQNMQMVLDQGEKTLKEKTEESDARQAEIRDLDEKITLAHAAQMEGMEAVHRAENAAREVQERRDRRQEDRERISAELNEAEERIAELDALAAQSGDGSETRSSTLEKYTAQLDAAKAAEEAARAEEAQKEETLENHKNEMLEAVNRRAAALSNQTRLNTMLTTMESRLEELTVSCEEMRREGAGLEAAVSDARARLEKETAEQDRLSASLQEARAGLEAADAEVIDARAAYDRKLAEMRDMESRQQILDEMSREMEGYSNSVRRVVHRAREKGDSRVRGPVSRLISVPREYETAIDMVLGATQQHVVTEDEETAKEMIEYLRENGLGRATFLPLTTVKPRLLTPDEQEALKLPGCVGVASDLVSCDEEYRGIVENLLGRTVIARDLASGIPIMRKGDHAFRLVTLQGDVMHSGGSMTGGSVSSRNVNLFTRERELKELTEKLSAGQDELERLLKQMRDGQQRKDELKERSAGALEELHQQEIAVARETERVQNAESDANTHSLRLHESEAAREQLMESMMQIREQLSMATDSTEATDRSREEMEAQAAVLQQALTEARKQTEEKAEETLRLTLEVNDLKHELETLQRDRARYEQDRKRMAADQERRRRQLAEMETAEAADLETAAKAEKDLEQNRLEQARREQAARTLEEDRAGKQELLTGILADIEGLHQSRQRDTDRMHRLELGRTRTEGDLKALRDRIWNTYEITYAGAEEFRMKEGFSLTEADREAAQLSAEIRALGPVNVRAVEEYADTKARVDEITAQREDLEKAEKDLKDLITRLLSSMKETFVEQFTRLQGFFSETFVRLFGGGHAELILMDPNDPLNCGIEINAQPPGKKLQLLSLLSGGERTLTAIAILFATLMLKPTPFCILDEIEAALDDANIGYFADYLEEFSKSTQFVVITHRKGTMERANGLYGVAMEEQGVSRMVSVSLQDYRE